jgi:hypothetical protein
MLWPDGSWVISKLLGDGATRNLASISLVLVAIAFVVGGLGLLLRYHVWRPVTVGTAVFSTLVFILLWNGGLKGLDDQGGIGVLIKLAILVMMLIVK